jgi:hypothetical protein
MELNRVELKHDFEVDEVVAHQGEYKDGDQ